MPKKPYKCASQTGAQIGKTEILINTLGYYLAHDPSPILVCSRP